MTNRNWLPEKWFGGNDENNPFSALRQQIDSLLEDFDKGLLSRAGGFAVRSNVSETENEVRITAELPGVPIDDIDVSVVDNRITIKGEKKSEQEETGEKEGREFQRVERYSGSFERSLALPFDIDPASVEASVKDGVLTVVVPKPPEAAKKPKKVAVKKAD